MNCTSYEDKLEKDKPNFLFIISDDQSWLHASAYGNKVVQTPEFDRLAKQGFLFNNAFCASPHCSVSRATILTGLNQWQLAEAGTHGSNFPARFKVIPEILLDHGYSIGYTGKPWSPGNWKISGRKRNPAGEQYNDFKMESLPAKFLTTTDPVKNFEKFLESRKDNQPFWFWYGSIEPHVKYEKGIGLKHGIDTAKIDLPAFLPDHPDAKMEMADYYFEIQWFDQQIGWLRDFLEEKGLSDNTVIVVTADNGIVLPRAKRSLYEWGIHMPLAIYWPRMKNKGLQVDRLTSFIDFAPTFLDLAGIDIPNEITGKSFANLFLEEGINNTDFPQCVLTGFERHDHRRDNNLGYPIRSIRTNEYLFIKNYEPDRWPEGDPVRNKYGIKVSEPESPGISQNTPINIEGGSNTAIVESSWTDNYSYYTPGSDLFHLAFGKRPKFELYDIKADPECMVNLAESRPHLKLRDSLHNVLKDLLIEQGDPRELGYGDIFESYPRYGSMKEYLDGFKKPGEYNKEYHYHPSLD